MNIYIYGLNVRANYAINVTTCAIFFAGLALSVFQPYATDRGSIIPQPPGDATVYFNTIILNVGEDIPLPSPDTDTIFRFNMYMSTQGDLDGAILLNPVTYTNDGPRNIAMRKQTAIHFSSMSATFSLPGTACVGKQLHFKGITLFINYVISYWTTYFFR